jgi:ABC-type multidrug transport system fused ATPase/permease subunit
MYPLPLSGLLIAAATAAVLETLALASFYPLLTAVLGTGSAGAGSILGAAGRLVEALPADQRLTGSLVLFVGAVVASSGAKFLREWAMATVSTGIAYDVKRRIFGRLLEAPYLYLVALRPGDVVYRVTNAPPYLATTLLVTSQILSLLLSAAAVVVLLLTIDVRLTALVLALGTLFYAVNRYVLLGTLAEAGRRRVSAALAEAAIATEFAAAAKEVQVAGVGPSWLGRFLAQAAVHRRNLRRDLVLSAVPGLAMEATVLAAIGVVAVIVRLAAPDLLTALPLLAVYGLAVRQLLGVLGQVSRHWLRLAAFAAEVRLLRDALVEPYPHVRSGQRALPADWRSIMFDRVVVRYPDRDVDALEEVSLEIPRGTTVALVGPSGSGKTTVLALLLRLFDPSAGRVRLDGLDLADVERGAWTRRIGYVAQEGAILDASVAENIAFGRSVRRADIERAAREANAVEFIEALPEGYDARLGDRGLTLSAGQRQRLLIARALVHRPDLVLLDEATSSLDSRSEQLVQDSLTRLRGEHTVVVVGHRLSAVRGADRIFVLDRGRIVETGDHSALMRRGGVYAELARIQGSAATP